jgi:hypothetical protein
LATLILQRPKLRYLGPQRHKFDPGGICAAVIHDNNLVRNTLDAQFQMQVLDGGDDAAFFIARRNHDAQQLQGRPVGVGSGTAHIAPQRWSQSGFA